jgi:predicted DNA-binding mobile mystery protein A
MKRVNAARRRSLDDRLENVGQHIGPRPQRGWLREIRDALGMSSSDLAARLGVTHGRVSQLERAELDGSIGIGTLERAAQAMHCELRYVLIPTEPLVGLVYTQARRKAIAEAQAQRPPAGDECEAGDVGESIAELIEARTYELIDSFRLWRRNSPDASR